MSEDTVSTAGGALRVILAGPVAAVAKAAAGNARGRKEVAALVRALRGMGEADVADDLEPLVRATRRRQSAYAIGAWAMEQYGQGRIGDDLAWACQDIRRALALVGCPGSRVVAVDPSRIVVDGGSVDTPTVPSGGRSIEPCVTRYDAWRREVRERADIDRRVLRGRKSSMSYVAVVTAIICDGRPVREVEQSIGVRNGRCASLVLAELRRYAKLREIC